MVSNDLLFYIHMRFNKIFGSVTQEPWFMVIAKGDFLKLQQLGGSFVYSPYLLHFLSEVMWQRGDSQLIDLLNSVRIADVKPSEIELLASKVINLDHKHYLHNALHIFAENASAWQQDLERLQSVKSRLYLIASVEKLPANISAQKTK